MVTWLDGPFSPVVQTHESKVGLLYLLNSALPSGLGSSAGLVSGLTKYLSGRPVFGLDQDPATLPSAYVTPTWASVTPTNRSAVTVIGAKGYCHAAYGSYATTTGSRVGGLWRIVRKSSTPVTEEFYYVSGNDIQFGQWEGARTHLIDHAFDTHIRPGDIEISEKILNTDYTFEGQASAAFDDFFESAGQEIAFRPKSDSTVSLDIASENSRGSSSNPIHVFVDGPKCKISVKIPTNPFPDAVIGLSTIPNASADWQPTNHTWIEKILTSGSRDGADLSEYLDLLRADDATVYEITAYEDELLLWPGDWISADGVPCRIRKIVEMPGITTITAGRKYLDISDRWGEWRNAIGSIDITDKIQSKEFDYKTHTGSTTFTVKASEKTAAWRARLSLRWSVPLVSVGGGGTVNNSNVGAGTITPSGTYTGEDDAIYTLTSIIVGVGYAFKWKKDNGSWTQASASSGATKTLSEGVKVKFVGKMPTSNIYAPYTWYVYAASHVDSIGNPCIIAKINDQIIPPGRIRMANALSGSVDIDITDCCRVGSNTLQATIYGGMTKAAYPNHYHQLSGSIDQYQRALVVDNA